MKANIATLLISLSLAWSIVGCKHNTNEQFASKKNEALHTETAHKGDKPMSGLTQAIKQNDPRAVDIAARMGKSAIPELESLLKNDDSTIRMMSVRALEGLDLNASYPLLFGAIDDEDINVVHDAVHLIEKRQSEISTKLLFGLLEKIQEPTIKVRIILLLGNRLQPEEVANLETYCSTEHPQVVALNCMAALAKIGIEIRRKQFAQYLITIRDDGAEFLNVFELVDYISQPWVAPSLRLLLANETKVEYLGDQAAAFGLPSYLRVCDKAALFAGKILELELSFDIKKASNFTDEQLAEVNMAIAQYKF